MNLLSSVLRQKQFVLFGGLLLSFGVFILDASNPLPLTIDEVRGHPLLAENERSPFLPFRMNSLLEYGNRVQTGPHDSLQIETGEDFSVRLEPGSEAAVFPARLFEREKIYRFELKKGTLSGAQRLDGGKETVSAAAGPVIFETRGGAFALSSADDGSIEALVLKGEAGLKAAGGDTMILKPMEAAFFRRDTGRFEKRPLTVQEWQRNFAAYALTPRPGDFRSRQLSLAKAAGSLFDHVYYSGEFYTEGQGYLESLFLKDGRGESHMRIYYDLQMRDSFAGAYFQTKDFYLDQYDTFSFELRQSNGLAPPGEFRIEFKKQQQIIRSFIIKEVPEEWEEMTLPLKMEAQSPVTEVVILFNHRFSGPGKRGGLELRRLSLQKKGGERP